MLTLNSQKWKHGTQQPMRVFCSADGKPPAGFPARGYSRSPGVNTDMAHSTNFAKPTNHGLIRVRYVKTKGNAATQDGSATTPHSFAASQKHTPFAIKKASDVGDLYWRESVQSIPVCARDFELATATKAKDLGPTLDRPVRFARKCGENFWPWFIWKNLGKMFFFGFRPSTASRNADHVLPWSLTGHISILAWKRHT